MELVAKSSEKPTSYAHLEKQMPSIRPIPRTTSHISTVVIFSLVIVLISLGFAATLAILRHLNASFPATSSHQINHTSQPQVYTDKDKEAVTPALEKPPSLYVTPPTEYKALPTAPLLPTTTVADPEVLELLEVARALRSDGDTAEALQKLRQADSRMPATPRILWELNITYKAMALEEKAQEKLTQIVALGPKNGGDYYQIAKLSVGNSNAKKNTVETSDFSFGRITTTPQPEKGDGERILVRMAIHSYLEYPVSPEEIAILIEFYDLVDGTKVERTRSNAPTSHWPTQPVNWSHPETEIVEWQYHMPILTPSEIADFGKRRYYGFIARLYYRDKLQDVYAQPRILLASPPKESVPLLDDSLFPDSDQ